MILTDHIQIKEWALERNAFPAKVKGTGLDEADPGILRFDFEEDNEIEEPNLERINWEEFFKKFEENKLALICQDQTKDGGLSRFHKFTNRVP